MEKLAIGVDIGGTRTKLGLVDIIQGKVLEMLILPTEKKDSSVFLDGIANAIHTFKSIAVQQHQTIRGTGVGVPGFVFENGVVDSTYGFLAFMEDYPLKELIENEHGIECRLDNDARVVALGEALYGVGKGYNRVLVLTLGTGLGIGFVMNGKLNEALAFGHMGGNITITNNNEVCYCGKTGCLESLVSATGLCHAATKINWQGKYRDVPLSAENIFKEREKNNPDAIKLVADFISYLRTGIDNYINLFAPDMVVLGGGVAKGLIHDIEQLQSTHHLRPYKNYKVAIATSILQEEAGVLGSAALFH